MKKKKSGGKGQFGSRYGKRIRNEVLKIQQKKKKVHKCPECSRVAVRRISRGIWKCNKCNIKFASGAYDFQG